MKLCAFTIELQIPDDLPEHRQDELLEQVDAISLNKSLTNHTVNRLSKNGIPYVTVKVEE